MNCIGIETFGGSPVEVAFGAAISSVKPAATVAGQYLAPGFIDLQVNGFLGT